MLLLDAPLDSQPQEAVEVDWGNPLASGLVWAHVGASPQNVAGSSSNLVGPEQSPPQGLAGYEFNSAQYIRGDMPPLPVGGVSTGMAFCTFSNVSGNRIMIGAFSSQMMYVCLEGNNFATVANDGAFKVNASSVQPVSGQPYAVVGRFLRDAGQEIWVDGRLLQASATPHTAQPTVINVGIYDNGGGGGFIGVIHTSAWWNRALTDDEIRSVSANPWQLFRAPVDAWVPRVTPTVLTPDATLANTNWSAVGAASLHAALAAGDSDYITASADGASATVSLSNPVPNLIDLTSVVVSVRHRVT
jgi:hypothetical protein